MRALMIITLIFLFFPLPTLSETIHVPRDYSTIQMAIENAENGDTVLVVQGTYMENIDFLGKAISVVSESGYQAMIIDGSQAGSVVICNKGEGEDSVLDGFTITNGYSFYGGGINIDSSSPTIINCAFLKNEAKFTF